MRLAQQLPCPARSAGLAALRVDIALSSEQTMLPQITVGHDGHGVEVTVIGSTGAGAPIGLGRRRAKVSAG